VTEPPTEPLAEPILWPSRTSNRTEPLVEESPQQLLLPEASHSRPSWRHALAQALGFGQVGEEVLATAFAVSRFPRRCGLRSRLVCGHLLVTAFA